MQFRRLTRQELEELEPQFVRFLAAQGIPADDWAKIKVTDEERTNRLIDQFSAMVFDDVLRRAEYMEQRSAKQLLVYRCGAEKLELRGLLIEGESALDFRREEPPHEMMAKLQSSPAKLKVMTAERAYRPDRATDLFNLLEKGARIAKTPELFDLLDGLINAKTTAET